MCHAGFAKLRLYLTRRKRATGDDTRKPMKPAWNIAVFVRSCIIFSQQIYTCLLLFLLRKAFY
jgi:hypothetical protein